MSSLKGDISEHEKDQKIGKGYKRIFKEGGFKSAVQELMKGEYG